MQIKPTTEQQDIISYASKMDAAETLTITAFAGAAKTSSLVMLASAYPENKFLYLAFNKAIVEEAKTKFPTNVDIKTTHSLAYAYTVGKRRIRNNYKAAEIGEIFNLEFDEASYALKVFDFYCNSALSAPAQLATDSSIITVVSEIYDRMRNGELDITHSWYLKEFQLSLLGGKKIRSSYDYALLDEAQDTNSVTLSIFNHLPGRKIKVGDAHQAIYLFRGAINGINDRGGGKGKNTRKSLTTTFRCLPHIVDQANWVLETFKGEKHKIVSGNNREPKIETVAVLSRTNSTLIEQMDELKDFNLTRPPEIIFESILSVLNWKYGFNHDISKNFKFMTKFKTMVELNDYIEATNDQELRTAIKTLEKYDSKDWTAKGYPRGGKIRAIFDKACRNYKHNGSSAMTLSSTHSSKGLEFDKVILCPDFPDLITIISKLMEMGHVETPEDFINGKKSEIAAAREEVNLYYVAVTRAKYELLDLTPAACLYKEKKSIYEVFAAARAQTNKQAQ